MDNINRANSPFLSLLMKERPFLFFLFALLCTKIALLFYFKPVFNPDSGGYEGFADLLLRNDASLHRLNLHSSYIFATALRMIGYPATIAFFKLCSPKFWPFLICLFQIALSLYVSCIFYLLCRWRGLPLRWSLFAVVGLVGAYSLFYDQTILTDSLFASLFIVFLCRADFLLFSDPPRPGTEYLKAGLLLAGCFLIRDSTPVQILVLTPVLGSALLKTPRLDRLGNIGFLLLPFALTYFLYGTWNYVRSGSFFITTGAQTSFLYPLLKIASSHPEVLQDDDPVSKMARESFVKYEFLEVWEVNRKLYERYGFTPLQIASLSKQKYIQLWKDHPKFVIEHAIKETPWAIVVSPFRELETVKDLAEWVNPESYWPSLRRMLERLPGSWKPSEILFVVLVNISRALGLTVSLFFLLGVPVRFFREHLTKPPRSTVSLTFFAYWLTFLLYIIAFAVLHVETRYLMPVFMISTLFGVLVMYDYVQARMKKSVTVSTDKLFA